MNKHFHIYFMWKERNYHVIAEDEKALHDFISYMKKNKQFMLRRKYSAMKHIFLTDNEKECLSLAYTHGYLDSPKKISIEELGRYRKKGKKSSTIACHVRSAIKKIVQHIYDKDIIVGEEYKTI